MYALNFKMYKCFFQGGPLTHLEGRCPLTTVSQNPVGNAHLIRHNYSELNGTAKFETQTKTKSYIFDVV